MNTESVNERTSNISEVNTEQMLYMINAEDALVADIVKENIPHIAKLVELGAETIRNGGRIIYCGAGTSGRLAVADAAECPPTYGVDKNCIKAVIAGGVSAMIDASEGCEDDVERGIQAFDQTGAKAGDLAIGISAAGRAPFVCAFMKRAKEKGLKVGAIVNNENTLMSQIADITIMALTGAEAIKGSTRMKAGTSQKMILNMFSTAVMIRLGNTYKNFMVNMQPTNEKLRKRAVSMLVEILSIEEEKAKELLLENKWSIKESIKQFYSNNK